MKKFFLALIVLASSHLAHASVTINLTAGVLSGTTQGIAAPTNCLVQFIIAGGTSALIDPTASSFLGASDNTILSSFLLDPTSTGAQPPVNGTFTKAITFDLGTNNVLQGKSLLLRWWPTLTTSSSSPGSNTPYGQFRISGLYDGSTTDWLAPADGTYTLNFLTASIGGSQSNSAGVANKLTPAAVPEPGSLALMGLGVTALVALRRKRQA